MPEKIEKSIFTTKVQETEDMPLPEHLQQMYNTSVKNLSAEEAKQVKHVNIFSRSKSDLGNCGIIPHHINTGSAPPTRLSAPMRSDSYKRCCQCRGPAFNHYKFSGKK